MNKFMLQYEISANQILDSFRNTIERSLVALDAQSSAITSFARATNATFPFVTMPDFEIRGTNLRIQSGSHILHWLPLVTDQTRTSWEEYASENRFQIEEAFANDFCLRTQQDVKFGLADSVSQNCSADCGRLPQKIPTVRDLQDAPNPLEGIINDGTGYHQRIWTSGPILPPGIISEGNGPYLPTWQRR